MATVGSLSVLLSASSKAFENDMKRGAAAVRSFSQITRGADGSFTKTSMNLSRTNSAAGGMFGTMRSGIGTVAKLSGAFLAANVAASAIRGTLSGIGGAITKAFSTASFFEDQVTSFGVMLGSVQKAQDMSNNLTSFAATTPFELPEVFTAAKQLLAFGSSAETVVDELELLGNLAAGVGSSVGELAYLHGTLRTQGRAMTVDLRQYATRGIPIFDALAKTMGVSTQRISELTSEGKIGFAEVDAALRSLTAEGGRFHNLMGARSQTLSGLWSNLQDTLTVALGKIGQAFVDALDIKALIAGYTRFAGALVRLVIPAMEKFGGWINKSVGGGEGLLEMWMKVARAVNVGIATGVDMAIAGVSKLMSAMAAAATQLSMMLNGIATQFSLLANVPGMGLSKDAADGLQAAAKAAADVSTAMWNASNATRGIDLASKMSAAIDAIEADVLAFPEPTIPNGTGAGSNFAQQFVNGVRSNLASLAGIIEGNVTTGWQAMKEGFSATFKEMQDRAAELTESVATPMEKLRSEVGEAQRLLNLGLIDPATFSRLKMQWSESLAGMMPEPHQMQMRFAQLEEVGVGGGAAAAAMERQRVGIAKANGQARRRHELKMEQLMLDLISETRRNRSGIIDFY